MGGRRWENIKIKLKLPYELIKEYIQEIDPNAQLIIIDSIQTMYLNEYLPQGGVTR